MYKIKLFLDESGKYSLASDEPFILTGVVLPQRHKTTVEGYFNYIKRKYKIPTDRPYHIYEIFESPATKLTDSTLKNYPLI